MAEMRREAFGPRQNTSLHIGARVGNPKVLLLMLKNGGAPHIDVRNVDGETPLFYAVNEQSKMNTQTLIDMRANLAAVDIFGSTVLDMAKKRGLSEFVDFLEASGAASG